MLLPRITALGALDEAPLALAGALDLPPAVEPMQRLAALSTLILAMKGEGGAPRTADRAWLLAQELASLMDEAERAGIDLAERLPDAADPEYAAHWAQTLKFLHIVTDVWPAWLAENGVMNPAARQVALLEAQAQRLGGRTAGPSGADRRHHGRHSRRRRLAARRGADAAGAGRAAAAGSGYGPRTPGRHWRRPTPRPVWPACWQTWMRHGATCGRGTPTPEAPFRRTRFGLLSRALLPASALHDWMDRRPGRRWTGCRG